MNKYIMMLPILALMGCSASAEPLPCSNADVSAKARSLAIELLQPYVNELAANLAIFNNFQPVNLTLNAGPDLMAIFDMGGYDKETLIRFCTAKIRVNVTTGNAEHDRAIYTAADQMAALNGDAGIIPLVFQGVEREIVYSVAETQDGTYVYVELKD